MIINLIGAGNLGKTLGYLFAKSGKYQIGAICNRSIRSAKAASRFIGAGGYVSTLSDLPAADVTLITTPDALITEISINLVSSSNLKYASTIIHCSGALSSDALIAVKKKNCYIASVHPMRSFADPKTCIDQYAGTYCALEGDAEIIHLATKLFQDIGSITYEICKTKKVSYHTAGVFASNYLVTLAQQALNCLENAGVEKTMAMNVITSIMKGTVLNLESTLSPQASLTGPIKRGDLAIIEKHLNHLDPPQQKLYATLGMATLPIVCLDKKINKKLSQILNVEALYRTKNH